MPKPWQGWQLLAACLCSIRLPQLSRRLLEQGLLRGCLCSLMFPLVFEDWKCWVWSSSGCCKMFRCSPEAPWNPWTGFYVGKSIGGNPTWGLDFSFNVCNCCIIKWLWPCAVLWMTFRVWDLSLNGFCVTTSHFCLPLWADQMWSLSKQNFISELLRWLSPKLFIGFINTVNCLKSPKEVLTEISMAD